ncbi:MAG TPA: DUF4173 domain-containing protein [Candidatus Limnocylindrales bacterium]|nr:DUF4173 domain-containing protein [Candidatus Limnocylindrales bacterium]
MASEALTSVPPTAAPIAWRPVVRAAGRVVVVASVLGLIGQVLFFDVGLGINLPIAIGLLLAGGWLVRRRTPSLWNPDAWLAPAALLFAAFAALRADPTIVALDLLTSLALAGGALAAFGGLRVVARPFWRLVALGFGAIGWAAAGAAPALAQARHSLPSAGSLRPRAGRALPVLRGLAVAVPIVLVFVALFSAADAVFAQVVDDLFGVEVDLGDIPGRLLVAAVLAWIAAGGVALAAAEHRSEDPQHAEPSPGLRIGTTEAVTVLGSVVVVFLLFVVLQGAYLFGGRDTLEATGITYADYARRGFFELVAVAFLAGGLVIGAERLVRDRTRFLVGMAISLVVLTGVVIVSSALRLRLYQDAYGWTELRFYVLATIVLLGFGAIALLTALASDRVRWIGHVLIGGALAIGLALNLIGPVRFISEQNVARVLDPGLVPADGSSGLDELYAISLADDALPALARVLPALEDGDAAYLAEALGWRLAELRRDEGLNAWQAWNAGRAAARAALEAADRRGELP